MRPLSTVLFLAIILGHAGVSPAYPQPLAFLCASTGLTSVFKGPCVDTFIDEEMRPFPPEPPVTIKIELPGSGDQFFFNSGDPGTLEINAVAVVTPSEYEDQVEWKMTDVGSSTKRFEPSQGANVTIKFEGLPKNNSDFGAKTITARVQGKSDSVDIEVFFFPLAKNHAGKGQGETPNWFYYWMQTQAAQAPESKVRYISKIPPGNRSGDTPIGRYERGGDVILISDLAYSSSTCTRRKEAGHGTKNATEIDCFAEVLRHEARHRYEEWEWWRKGSNVFLRFVESFVHDRDLDLVPAWLEKAEPGCVDTNMYSCTDRPTFTTAPKTVPDTELYAYYEGWKWVLESAKREDWSFGGQQWK